IVSLALVAAGCGKDNDNKSTKSGAGGKAKPTITVGSEKFSESVILAAIYGGALKAKGYTVKQKLRLGTREIYFPALERGEIDLVPEYAATLLEYVNKNAGQATP